MSKIPEIRGYDRTKVYKKNVVMSDVPVKIVAVCGSPVKEGNCEEYTRQALKAAEGIPNVETELIILQKAYKTLRHCNHCNYCATKQTATRFCSIKDDMDELYPKILYADGIILSSPAYVTRMTGLMAAFMDRLRPLYHGNTYVGGLHNKIGAALSVAFGRNCGVETTQLSILQGFLMWGAIPATCGLYGVYGAAGLSSYYGEGKVERDDRHSVLKDKYGMRLAKDLVLEVIAKAKIQKAGNKALGLENEYIKVYEQGIQEDKCTNSASVD
jgi:multimeric flavodoxin WrbA